VPGFPVCSFLSFTRVSPEGMVSNDWMNALNWDCGGIPTVATDVIIPPSTATGNYPILTIGQTGDCRTIDVQGPPSIIEIQDGATLHVDSP